MDINKETLDALAAAGTTSDKVLADFVNASKRTPVVGRPRRVSRENFIVALEQAWSILPQSRTLSYEQLLELLGPVSNTPEVETLIANLLFSGNTYLGLLDFRSKLGRLVGSTWKFSRFSNRRPIAEVLQDFEFENHSEDTVSKAGTELFKPVGGYTPAAIALYLIRSHDPRLVKVERHDCQLWYSTRFSEARLEWEEFLKAMSHDGLRRDHLIQMKEANGEPPMSSRYSKFFDLWEAIPVDRNRSPLVIRQLADQCL